MRTSKTEYYLDIAEAVSKRATCIRRQFGAVIVVNDQIVATGYCGAPRGVRDCLERKEKCLRIVKKIPSGQRYEFCRSVHAEQNAIINAARAGVSILGGAMYIYGYDLETDKVYNSHPCLLCLKMVINAGLEGIYYTQPKDEEGFSIVDLKYIAEGWSAMDMFDDREGLK